MVWYNACLRWHNLISLERTDSWDAPCQPPAAFTLPETSVLRCFDTPPSADGKIQVRRISWSWVSPWDVPRSDLSVSTPALPAVEVDSHSNQTWKASLTNLSRNIGIDSAHVTSEDNKSADTAPTSLIMREIGIDAAKDLLLDDMVDKEGWKYGDNKWLHFVSSCRTIISRDETKQMTDDLDSPRIRKAASTQDRGNGSG